MSAQWVSKLRYPAETMDVPLELGRIGSLSFDFY
jgi:hypothetical protein